MAQITNFLTPITVLLSTILIGNLIGKIKLLSISFGSSAILIVGIVLGLSLSSIYPDLILGGFISEIGLLASLGTSFFMSAIGLSSGYEMANNLNKKTYKSLIVGIAMILFGFAIMKIISTLDGKIDFSILLGVFCGAMTSTPALSAICESQTISSEMVTLGYGYAYPIGMIVAVLYSQLIMKKVDNRESIIKIENNPKKPTYNTFLLICICAVIGSGIGCIRIPILNSDIGTCGGILLVSMLTGLWTGKKNKNSFNITDVTMLRSIGLSLFLAGNGISCGMMITTHVNIKLILYSIIISAGTVAFGYVLCNMFFRFQANRTAFTLAGGMTSSPSLGAIIAKSTPNCLSDYSIAYLGALITVIALSVTVK